jgi:hypothetical protein
MEKFILVAFIIALLFGLGKFIIAKFVEKDIPPLKVIVRDTALTGIASLVTIFAMSQVESVWSTSSILPGSIATPQIFTDEPGF